MRGENDESCDRHPPVALDEHEQDVLAPQAGEQPVAGRVAEPVCGDLAGERLPVREAGAHRLHLVDGQGGGARGGDRRAGDAKGHPQDAQHGGRPQRPAAVAGRDPCYTQQRQDRKREQRDDRARPRRR